MGRVEDVFGISLQRYILNVIPALASALLAVTVVAACKMITTSHQWSLGRKLESGLWAAIKPLSWDYRDITWWDTAWHVPLALTRISVIASPLLFSYLQTLQSVPLGDYVTLDPLLASRVSRGIGNNIPIDEFIKGLYIPGVTGRYVSAVNWPWHANETFKPKESAGPKRTEVPMFYLLEGEGMRLELHTNGTVRPLNDTTRGGVIIRQSSGIVSTYWPSSKSDSCVEWASSAPTDICNDAGGTWTVLNPARTGACFGRLCLNPSFATEGPAVTMQGNVFVQTIANTFEATTKKWLKLHTGMVFVTALALKFERHPSYTLDWPVPIQVEDSAVRPITLIDLLLLIVPLSLATLTLLASHFFKWSLADNYLLLGAAHSTDDCCTLQTKPRYIRGFVPSKRKRKIRLEASDAPGMNLLQLTRYKLKSYV